MDIVKTGQYIASCRRQRGLTQQQLADELGITNKAVSKWETGLGMPDISILPDLSRVLRISIDSIIYGHETQPISASATPAEKSCRYFSVQTSMSLHNMKESAKYISKAFDKKKRGIMLVFAAVLILLSGTYLITRWIQNAQNEMLTYLLPGAGLLTATIVIAICLWGHLTRAVSQYADLAGVGGTLRTTSFSLYNDHLKIDAPSASMTLAYDSVEKILDTPRLIILKCRNRYFFIEKSGIQGKNATELLTFLKEKCQNAFVCFQGASPVTIKRKVTASILGAISLFLILGQIAYLTVVRHYGFEYIHDMTIHFVHGAIILTAMLSLAILFWHRKNMFAAVIVIAMFMLAGNTYLAVTYIATNESLITSSPDHSHTLILKRSFDTGKTTVYRNTLLWFARPHEQFPYTVTGELKTQWLTTDICAVTYISPDDNQTHQYVATYGLRSEGYSYDYVRNALNGGWRTRVSGWEFRADTDGITLKSGGIRENYSYDDCVQFGTIALVLCKEGLPQWTIALNEDIKIVRGTPQGKGSITVCKVSMDETAPVIFFSTAPTTNETPEASSQYPASLEQGEALIEQMKLFFSESSDISTWDSSWFYAKVITDSTDMFWVARLALEEHIWQENRHFRKEAQITEIQVLAGDIHDFLVVVTYDKTSYDPLSQLTSRTESSVKQFRIMKGDGVYLAGNVGPTVDGGVGLTPIGMEQKLNTQGDRLYSFIVPELIE